MYIAIDFNKKINSMKISFFIVFFIFFYLFTFLFFILFIVISNALVLEMVKTTNRHGIEKGKPNVVKIYNENMFEIDRSNQMLSYHLGLRKTIRWYKKIGMHLTEVTLTNAYYMFASMTPYRNAKNRKDFREVVVDLLIGPPRNKRWMRRDHR